MKKQEYKPIKTEEYMEKLKEIKTKQVEKIIQKYNIDIYSLSAT